MAELNVTERQFEEDIQHSLCTRGGYCVGDPHSFNRKLALDTGTFLSFIQASQPNTWKKYVSIYGADSEERLIHRFCDTVKKEGLLHILRQGFKDRGLMFRVVFWKPETTINETACKQYEANILHCTRQLHYSLKNENSIDIVLFLNGIPVVSMELKNQFTGQDTTNAINQYKFDRAGNDAAFAFKNRILVHFAVDRRHGCRDRIHISFHLIKAATELAMLAARAIPSIQTVMIQYIYGNRCFAKTGCWKSFINT